MKVSDITAAVSDLWAFVWPPVVVVSLLVGVAKFIAPQTLRSVGIGLLDVSTQWASSIRPHLEGLGLTKLIPAVALFAVIFTLYVVRVLVFASGSFLPPTVSYRPDVVMATYLHDAELICLWKHFPRDLSFHRIVQEVRESDGGEQEKYWEQRAGRNYARFGAVKFLAIWAIVMFFIELARSGWSFPLFSRLSVTLACCALALLVFLGLYLYGIQQQAYADLGNVRHFLFQDKECDEEALKPSVEEEDHINYLRNAQWWGFEVSGWRYTRWMYQNLAKRTANPLLQQRTRDTRR